MTWLVYVRRATSFTFALLIVRISGFVSISPAIAIVSAHLFEGPKNIAVAGKTVQHPEILPN